MRNYVAESGAREAQTSDTIVHVDRATARPVYPNWMGAVLHPELQKTGLAEYDLRTVEKWLHDDQKEGVIRIRGKNIQDYLEDNDMLGSYLGIVDGLEIQKKSVELFRELFGGPVFLPRSPIEDRSGFVYVPYLFEKRNKTGSEVAIGWYWIGGQWHGFYFMLRFRC